MPTSLSAELLQLLLALSRAIQTPKDEERAAIHRPKVTMLYTRGSNATLSEQLTSGLLQPPAVQASTLLAAQQYLTEFTALQMPATTIPGELFALLGLQRLGTSSIVTEAAGLYLETALASVSMCERTV
jgi:hypothetical protein